MKGFEYQGKKYLWHKKELYRLPFERNLRFYQLKKVAKWSDRGYILGSSRKSFGQLKIMTVDVSWTLPVEEHFDTPF